MSWMKEWKFYKQFQIRIITSQLGHHFIYFLCKAPYFTIWKRNPFNWMPSSCLPIERQTQIDPGMTWPWDDFDLVYDLDLSTSVDKLNHIKMTSRWKNRQFPPCDIDAKTLILKCGPDITSIYHHTKSESCISFNSNVKAQRDRHTQEMTTQTHTDSRT